MQTCFTISLWLTKLLSIRLELFISLKLVLKMSSIFSRKQTNDSYRFISKLMDVYMMAGVHQQPDQSNYLAEGQIFKLVKLPSFGKCSYVMSRQIYAVPFALHCEPEVG